MKRWIFHISAGVSVVLAVAVMLLWIKGSRSLGDSGGWAWYNSKSRTYYSLQINSAQGCISFGGLDFVYDETYLGEGKRLPPPETWETGWFWQDNITLLVPPRGWFTSGSIWNRAGFDLFNEVTLVNHDRWRHWGVVMPDWLLILVLSVVPGTWVMGWPKRRRVALRRKRGLCLTCGYDLRAHQAGQRCPECGAVFVGRVARGN